MEQGQVVRPRSPRARSTKPDSASSVRRDPPMSHIDGMREGRLTGDGYRPKDFHYVWVHKAAIRLGVEYYEMIGYRCVTKDDGVKVTGRFRARDGEIEMMGHVLMCCPIDRHKEIVKEGPGGDTGLQLTSKIEKQIVGKQSLGMDTLRNLGVQRRHMRLVANLEEREDEDPSGSPEDEEA